MLHSQIWTPWNSNNDQDLTSSHLKSFLEPAVPPIRLFLMINMMPLKRCVVKVNYFTALLRNEARNKFLMSGPWLSVAKLRPLSFACTFKQLWDSVTFPHALENNHACKWTSNNFPGMIIYVLFLENCQETMCMHGYSPIHVDRFLRVWHLGDKSVPYFWEQKGPFHVDWRTTMNEYGL